MAPGSTGTALASGAKPQASATAAASRRISGFMTGIFAIINVGTPFRVSAAALGSTLPATKHFLHVKRDEPLCNSGEKLQGPLQPLHRQTPEARPSCIGFP